MPNPNLAYIKLTHPLHPYTSPHTHTSKRRRAAAAAAGVRSLQVPRNGPNRVPTAAALLLRAVYASQAGKLPYHLLPLPQHLLLITYYHLPSLPLLTNSHFSSLPLPTTPPHHHPQLPGHPRRRLKLPR